MVGQAAVGAAILLAAQLVGLTPQALGLTQALVLAPQAVALRLRATRGFLVPTRSTGATLVRHTQVYAMLWKLYKYKFVILGPSDPHPANRDLAPPDPVPDSPWKKSVR